MWIPTYHAFPSRAAFLAACDASWLAAGAGRQADAARGSRAAGDRTDRRATEPRRRWNARSWGRSRSPLSRQRGVARHGTARSVSCGGRGVHNADSASALSLPEPPPELPVPPVVAAWKAKEVLAQRGLLDDVETAVAAAGGFVIWALTVKANCMRASVSASKESMDVLGSNHSGCGNSENVLTA